MLFSVELTGPILMIRLLYSSHAAPGLPAEALVAILATARDRNPATGITGVLVYHQGRFVQVLEGPVAAVELLMARIETDLRNTDIERLYEEDAEARLFGDWSMAFLPLSDGRAGRLAGALGAAGLKDLVTRLAHQPGLVPRFTADILSQLRDPGNSG